MKEIITIESQDGPLQLIGGKYDAALLLNGEPVQFTFIREIGSTIIVKLDSKKIDVKTGLGLFKKCGGQNIEYKDRFLSRF